MKKTKTVGALVATLLLTLSACGGGDSESGDNAPAAPSGTKEAKGEINYWLWDANQLPAYQECADAFQAANPDIKVKVSQYVWDDYWAKLSAGFTSGTGPEVFTNHLNYYPEMIAKQQILPLSDALAADKVDTSIYANGLLNLWTGQDGKIYGLPKDFDTVALFYNKKLLSEAGVTEEEMKNLTWNPADGGTFEKVIAKLSIDANGKRGDEAGFDPKNVKVYGTGTSDGSSGLGQTQWSMYTAMNGWHHLDKTPWGTKFQYDDPKFTQAMDWYRGLIAKGYMIPLDKVIGIDNKAAHFAGGVYATITEGSWNAGSFTSQQGVDVGIAPLPTGPDGKRASMFNGLADSVSASTPADKQAAAVKWIEFTGSTGCQDIVAKHAIVFPAIPSSTEKAVAAFKEKGVDMSPFTDRVSKNETFLFPITNHAADVDAIMKPAMQAFLTFHADSSSFVQANEQVNALFK